MVKLLATARFLTASMLLATPAISQTIEQEVDAEVAAAVDSAMVQLAAEDLQERRLELCRQATQHPSDWSTRIRSKLEVEPELGSFSRVMEVCLAYLQGQRDALLERSY